MSMNVSLVKRFGYRTARPKNFLFSVPRSWVNELEEELNKQAGTRKDNHTVFVFKTTGIENLETYSPINIPNLITVQFTDMSAIFGTGIVESTW